jgi:hypothetical protein
MGILPMKKLIKNLSLREIDFLVAKAENLDDPRLKNFGALIKVDGEFKIYSPTTNPSQAWPIIEREKITIIYDDDLDEWLSEIVMLCKDFVSGKTSLEAAMRAYVASKFGDEVKMDKL